MSAAGERIQQAIACERAGDAAGAAQAWRAAVDLDPAVGEAWHHLGRALAQLGRYDEAEAAHRQAVAVRPDAPWAHRGLANFLHAVGRWAEAAAPYRQALALAPDDARLRTDFGHLLLGLGDFAAGWPLYESRRDVEGHGVRPPPLPGEWLGEPVAGKAVLVWPEQGFGDLVQFARYAPLLRDLRAAVTLASPPELAPLFEGLGVDVVVRGPSTTVPQPDVWSLALSLPHRLGETLADVRGEAYLRAPAERAGRWRGAVPPRAVGVVWRGRSSHPNDRHRSLPHDRLTPLVREHGFAAVDLTEPVGDFADLAALIERLELVIAVDTAAAHLAGALGKPCWILLPAYRQDWRWFQRRPDSPWYGSVRLFRQPAPGDWGPVLEEVAAALAQL